MTRNPQKVVQKILEKNWLDFRHDLSPIDRSMSVIAKKGVKGMNTENIRLLINELVRIFAKNGVYLEVGVYRGASLISAALHNPDTRCIGIDDFSRLRGQGINDSVLTKHFSDFSNPKNIEFHRGDYREIIPAIFDKEPRMKVDVYLYDGPHSYEHQLNGLEIIAPHMSAAGIIIVDDVNWKQVQKANDDFLEKHPEFVSIFKINTDRHDDPVWWNGLEILAKKTVSGSSLAGLIRFIISRRVCAFNKTNAEKYREKGLWLANKKKLRRAGNALKKHVLLGGSCDCFFEAAKRLMKMNEGDLAISFLEFNKQFLIDRYRIKLEFQKKMQVVMDANKEIGRYHRRVSESPDEYWIISAPIRESHDSAQNIDAFPRRKPASGKFVLYHQENVLSNNLAEEYDDLDGLLSEEAEIFRSIKDIAVPVPDKSCLMFWSVPNACPAFSGDGSVMTAMVSADGFRINRRTAHAYSHPLQISDQCLIKKCEKHMDQGFFLSPINHVRNYNHCLIDATATLQVYMQLKLACPIIFPDRLIPVQQTILEALGIPAERIFVPGNENGTVFREGFFACPNSIRDFRLAEFYRSIAGIISGGADGNDNAEKIYLSRRQAKKRRLLNEEELERALGSMGFSIYCMENFSFKEQIRIMQNASVVVSPHGAGLTNILFCKPGTTVIELVWWISPYPLYKTLALIGDQKYIQILGRDINWPERFNPNEMVWKIDVDKVMRAVEKVLERNALINQV